MKLELKLGKITHEFERLEKVKEVTTLEDVCVSVEVAADEIAETLKAIGEAIKAEMEAETRAKLTLASKEEIVTAQEEKQKVAAAVNDKIVESKKDSYLDIITIRTVPSSSRRKEIIVCVDNIVEYRFFTDFPQLLIDTLKNETEENAIVALLENVKCKKVTLMSVVNLDKEELEFILFIVRQRADKIKFI